MTGERDRPVNGRLPEPEGPGWDEEVRMTKRDLHILLNRHGDAVRADLAAAIVAAVEGAFAVAGNAPSVRGSGLAIPKYRDLEAIEAAVLRAIREASDDRA